MLSHDVQITSSSLTYASARYMPGDEPEIDAQPWLQLKGVLTGPAKSVRDVLISLYRKDKLVVGTARPASCGAVIRARPELQFVTTWPQHEFDRLWPRVLGNRLTHGDFLFTKGHYNTGLIMNVSRFQRTRGVIAVCVFPKALPRLGGDMQTGLNRPTLAAFTIVRNDLRDTRKPATLAALFPTIRATCSLPRSRSRRSSGICPSCRNFSGPLGRASSASSKRDSQTSRRHSGKPRRGSVTGFNPTSYPAADFARSPQQTIISCRRFSGSGDSS